MKNNGLKLIRELIVSPYGAYMSAFGVILACSNYDTYRMNKISNDLATKYNPNELLNITINIKNVFMCPVGRCNIYSINNETHNREFIASEVKFIVPPIIKLWDDEIIINSKSMKKITKIENLI
jgi:hypothetical protein